MAKGNIAKENIAKRIAQAFGSDYLGEFDKKIYVLGEENGEKIQIAISMTCPKVAVAIEKEKSAEMNFEEMPVIESKTVEISDEEKKNIADLMKRLGL